MEYIPKSFLESIISYTLLFKPDWVSVEEMEYLVPKIDFNNSLSLNPEGLIYLGKWIYDFGSSE